MVTDTAKAGEANQSTVMTETTAQDKKRITDLLRITTETKGSFLCRLARCVKHALARTSNRNASRFRASWLPVTCSNASVIDFMASAPYFPE